MAKNVQVTLRFNVKLCKLIGSYINMLEEDRSFSCPKLTLSPGVKR